MPETKKPATLDASFLLRLPKSLLDEIDAVVAAHKGPGRVTRVSLTRHALERAVREAKRTR